MAKTFVENIVARRVAMRVVRLKRHRPIEFRFRMVGESAHLPRNLDTTLQGDPGVYSLRFYERSRFSLFGPSRRPDYRRIGLATLGDVLPDSSQTTVIRHIEFVQNGRLGRAVGGWISGWLGTEPHHFAKDIEIVDIETNDGWHLPSWLQQCRGTSGATPRAGDSAAKPASANWVIHVHGRGANAAETARNFAQFAGLGFNNLAISFRNDGIARFEDRVKRGPLALGTAEWQDLEAAVAFAKSRGAEKIIVFGWSYGAAVSQQFARKSQLAKSVAGYIFDSPVISWRQTLALQAKLSGAQESWVALGEAFLKDPAKAKSIGLEHAINLQDFELPGSAASFEEPVLILHSQDDGYIPIEPCRELAAALPDTVRLVEFETARHCKLYNFDRPAYQGAIKTFTKGLLG